ncbi:50S ribosomal protein L3 [Spirochaetota bacterium]|nr:50S ribosomal protein L3 [Spirochaetota bacterium]
MIGLIGQKLGMTQIFNADGTVVPVTVIGVQGNRVVGLRTREKNNYDAVQVGWGENSKEKRKTLLNNFPGQKRPRLVREFRLDRTKGEELAKYKVGQELSLAEVKVGAFLDVTGHSIGKGFQGVVRRYGMHGGPATHGSNFHRHPGSIGHCTAPARVFKGKKLPGRMGGVRVTVQNLAVVSIDTEKGLLLISGAVPGKRNAMLLIRPSVKKPNVPQQVSEPVKKSA